jgi:hypothetical protein
MKLAIAGTKAQLYQCLKDAGLLPDDVINFSIDVPLEGAVTITCTYYAEGSIEAKAPEIAEIIRRFNEETENAA